MMWLYTYKRYNGMLLLIFWWWCVCSRPIDMIILDTWNGYIPISELYCLFCMFRYNKYLKPNIDPRKRKLVRLQRWQNIVNYWKIPWTVANIDQSTMLLILDQNGECSSQRLVSTVMSACFPILSLSSDMLKRPKNLKKIGESCKLN
jgi:hypothetical protein